MKKPIFLSLGILVIGSIFSASAQKRIVEVSTAQARNVEPQSAIIVAPQIAELSVSKNRASGSYTYEHNGAVDLTNVRAQALSDFQKEHNADVIVGALIDTRMAAKSITVTIQGYPASYSNIRAATNSDLWMLQFINSSNSNKNTESIEK